MEKDTLVKVINRSSGKVGYRIENTDYNRKFAPRETQEVPFEELSKLIYDEGAFRILKKYLVIKNDEARKIILPNIEPEYNYGEKEVIYMIQKATLDQFLDCLDFAPEGVIDLIKDLAVSLPCENVNKRKAILEKTGFDVSKAIEIQETKFDGETEGGVQENKTKRRAAAPVIGEVKEESARRAPALNLVLEK